MITEPEIYALILADHEARDALERAHGGTAIVVASKHFTDWGGWEIVAARDVPEGYWCRAWNRQFCVTKKHVLVTNEANFLGMVSLFHDGEATPEFIHYGGYVYVYVGEDAS